MGIDDKVEVKYIYGCILQKVFFLVFVFLTSWCFPCSSLTIIQVPPLYIQVY